MTKNTETTRFVVSLLLTGLLIIINAGTNFGDLYTYVSSHPFDLLGFMAISLIVVGGLQYLFDRFIRGADHEKSEPSLEV